ncbi:hypothetical protein [Massilia sp. ST3]|uniref:DUF7931 domain-containing protein n=1 Tax=Massilia sp. ST3 TaxID=2824903 RepID=UPI001B82B732|nr:hypothetical protein [Massilia sp. ST3]MBQ5946636.1 hypothetical protein [Massilia sp. ST3]
MDEPLTFRFDTRRECEAQFRACLAASSTLLELFDPDFDVFPLGAPDVDATLRAFLADGGRLRLALHDPAHIERHYPRFLRLLRDYGHLCECRQTPRGLRVLTDSFCIGDGRHVVRRFHSDHLRGEAVFHSEEACDVPEHRFAAIWEESRVVLQPSITGL